MPTCTVFCYQESIAIAAEKMLPNLIIANESTARKKLVIYFLLGEGRKLWHVCYHYGLVSFRVPRLTVPVNENEN